VRIRSIKPEFYRDAKLNGLPLPVKYVYIGLWLEADDSGMLRWDARQLALDILPDMPEAEALKLLTAASKALTRSGRLERLACGHAVIPTLTKHQRLHSDPSRRAYTTRREHDTFCLPGGKTGDARRHPGGTPEADHDSRSSGALPGGTPEVAHRLPAREGREGKGRGEKQMDNDERSSTSGARPRPAGVQSIRDLMPDLKPEIGR
jgi:hypothetical protein